jgi:hypothetical protein
VIENHLLHAAAWTLLRLLPPRRAFRWTARIAAALPVVREDEDARRIANALDSRGTCLSRSLTVAARLRDAEVVIAVDASSLTGHGAAFTAHAWVESHGNPLRPSDIVAGEIVRIRPTRED